LITLFQDVRYAIRILIKNPGFTLIAALSLALGIGANSAIFSLADALLLRPLPILEPSSVMDISTSTPDNPFGSVSYPNFRDLQAKSQSFDSMVAFELSTLSVATSAQTLPQVVSGVIASDNFFRDFGVQPILGRGFLPEEGKVPGRDAVVVIGYDFWQTQLGKDPSVIGRNLRIKGIDFTVIGVAPQSFTGVDQYFHPALYVPTMMTQRLDAAPTDPLEDRGNHSYSVKARLKPGASRQTAQAEVAAIWNSLKLQYPGSNETLGISVQTELQSRISHSPPDSALVALLMGLVSVVLLIACANVASLLLGRARARTREIALRISLGATRTRLLSQLLTESLLLALFGGALGLWFAYGGISFLQTIRIPSDPPITISPRMDARVLLFSVVAAVLSSVVFGLVPALRSLKTDLVPALKANSGGQTTGGGRTIGRNVLVIGQIALSMVLLVAAGMLLTGFRKMLAADPGFSTDRRLMLELDTSLVRYTPQQTRDFYRKLIDQTRGLSGVRSAALARSIPFVPKQYGTSVVPEGYQFAKGLSSDSILANIADDRYFETMNITVARGRTFTADDKDGSRRVAIVNEEFAQSYWPNQDALGKRFHLNDAKGPWLEIVGVTKTAKYLFPAETPTKFMYLPFAQNPSNQMLLIVETSGEPTPAIAQVRDVVRGIDPNQPVYNVRTLSTFFQQRAVAVPVMIAELITTLGLLGLTLALVGLYGVVAYSVSRRTQEIGIRMAIGANKQTVLRMIIRQGLTLSLLGIAVGGVATFAIARVLVAGLAGLGAMSPVTFVAVPILLVLVTLAACYIPARRASMVDPMVALHYE
jgi:macrolide transport system ATP-binding/permease protein